jgi:hypothetical protein
MGPIRGAVFSPPSGRVTPGRFGFIEKLAAMNQELPMTDLARQSLGGWLGSRG